jgi:hypothetical protein
MTAWRQQRDADAVNPRVPGFDLPVASVSFETVLARALAYNPLPAPHKEVIYERYRNLLMASGLHVCRFRDR